LYYADNLYLAKVEKCDQKKNVCVQKQYHPNWLFFSIAT